MSHEAGFLNFPSISMNVVQLEKDALKLATIILLVQSTDVVDNISAENINQITKTNRYMLVLFSKENCQQCQEALKVLQALPSPDMLPAELHKGQVLDSQLASRYGITQFPTLVFFRESFPALYEYQISVDALDEWLPLAADIATKILTDDTFEHLTQAATGSTTGDWLIVFYEPDCDSVLLAVESVAVEKKRLMNVARVDLSTSPKLKERFKISTCRHTIFFQQGKMYRYSLDKYDTKTLILFIDSWHKNMKKESVPVEPTAFDLVVDSIVQALKSNLEGPNRGTFLAIVGTVLGAISLLLSCCLCRCQRGKKIKGDGYFLYATWWQLLTVLHCGIIFGRPTCVYSPSWCGVQRTVAHAMIRRNRKCATCDDQKELQMCYTRKNIDLEHSNK
ncbi:hypothetical protein ScPMuIL_003273 [Solemya velum]